MIDVRRGKPHDLHNIFELYRAHLGREPGEERVARYVDEFPCAVAYDDRALVGFCFTVDFAPDILELANILVGREHRDAGVGARLLHEVEVQARTRFAGVILVNSELYRTAEETKRPATTFYERHGYRVIASTPSTRIFYKALQ